MRKNRIIMYFVLCVSLVFVSKMSVEAAGKYDAKLYQDVLNVPSLYSGTVMFDKWGKVTSGEEVYLMKYNSDSLFYIIKDITGDNIKELIVNDGTYTFIFTQKYDKKTKRMKVSTMAVIAVNSIDSIYFRKINGKRYLGIDWIYTGAGTNTNCIYQIKGTKLVLKNTIRYQGPFQSSTETYYQDNGKYITKKKYDALINKYFAKKYLLEYKIRNISYVNMPTTFYTTVNKITPGVLAIGTNTDDRVWSDQTKTCIVAYILTCLDAKKDKVKVSDVKKEMKNLFGTNKVKFSKSYPYNIIKKKGKWVTKPTMLFENEYPGNDVKFVYKTGSNIYTANVSFYIENEYCERIIMKEYLIIFKKSSGKYRYLITDIREVH